MAQGALSRKQLDRRPLWFNALLLLDAFALGGLVVWRFVLTFLQDSMRGFVVPSGEIFHVLDKISPYWLGHTAAAILSVWITAGAYLWLRTRPRVVPALTAIAPIILMIWLLTSRA